MTMKITTKEWQGLSKDFRFESGNTKRMLYHDAHQGTALIPVSIDDENGLEYGEYTFEDGEMTFHMFAYSMAEALRVILNSTWGHNPRMVKSLTRKTPYRNREVVGLINGRMVYIHGQRYEIRYENGLRTLYNGCCAPDATLRDVFNMHYLPQEKDTILHKDLHLFLCSGNRMETAADTAVLSPALLGELLEGYTLAYTKNGKEYKESWRTRPVIIAATGSVKLPKDFHMLSKTIYSDNEYIQAVAVFLDQAQVPWREL